MPKIYKRGLVGLVVVLLAIGAAYAWNSFPNPRRWERGYSQIAEGDPEQKVLDVLGKPTDIKDCYRPRYSGNDQLWMKCAEEYWYSGFMQEWVFVIGKNGTVIAKAHTVSP